MVVLVAPLPPFLPPYITGAMQASTLRGGLQLGTPQLGGGLQLQQQPQQMQRGLGLGLGQQQGGLQLGMCNGVIYNIMAINYSVSLLFAYHLHLV